MIEWTISFGNIITILTTVCGAVGIVLAFIYRWGIDINVILGRIVQIEKTVQEQAENLKEIQKVLVMVVRNDERLNQMDKRVNEMQNTRDEWRLDMARRLADIYQQQVSLMRRPHPDVTAP